ncbi:MAG TPA: 4-hydroxythreonine-4-phosphate dehydrogenase PdxA [Bacteroidetes bacterium]|nr:4-hydroxythreonine-4-phosphate dehydrogenase PdxA [Bacteroidota bacterium]
MSEKKIKVGITQGDINGIGYEVIIKTLLDPRINELCIPIIYGSPKVAAYHRKALNISNFSMNHIKSAVEANPKRANIINCIKDDIRVDLGKPTRESGEAALISLKHAIADLQDNLIDVLVTAPINKSTIHSEEFPFPGHTEYIEESFGEKGDSLMLMVGENLRIGVVTGHIPLAEVPAAIDKERVYSKIRIMEKTMVQDFRIRGPKIAMLGLNPHAGEEGLLGKEEEEIIIPAIKKAREEDNILVFGPYPADGFFGAGDYKNFDAVLAMYHDQGLAPFKAMHFEEGVNFTAGLPVVRTSPAHGTAYHLAGKGEASPEPFRQALYLAVDIYRNRKFYREITSDPLQARPETKE